MRTSQLPLRRNWSALAVVGRGVAWNDCWNFQFESGPWSPARTMRRACLPRCAPIFAWLRTACFGLGAGQCGSLYKIRVGGRVGTNREDLCNVAAIGWHHGSGSGWLVVNTGRIRRCPLWPRLGGCSLVVLALEVGTGAVNKHGVRLANVDNHGGALAFRPERTIERLRGRRSKVIGVMTA